MLFRSGSLPKDLVNSRRRLPRCPTCPRSLARTESSLMKSAVAALRTTSVCSAVSLGTSPRTVLVPLPTQPRLGQPMSRLRPSNQKTLLSQKNRGRPSRASTTGRSRKLILCSAGLALDRVWSVRPSLSFRYGFFSVLFF